MYRYISIRSDPTHAEFTPRTVLESLLDTYKELRRGADGFENAKDYPWLRVVTVVSDRHGNYTQHEDRMPGIINLIELICDDNGSDDNVSFYHALARDIAFQLKWEAYDETDEALIYRRAN